MDEDCAKLVYVSGSGQTGDICKTLKSPFVVAVEGGKLGQETVNWAITNTPSTKWAEPRFAGDLSNVEEKRIMYSKYFAPGSPGIYNVSASCDKCTNRDAEIPFTSTATCPTVPTYRQYNYPNEPYDNWCKIPTSGGKYRSVTCVRQDGQLADGYTEWTISKKGCALTSLAMVMGRYGSLADPAMWNNFMSFIGGYLNGAVVWTAPSKLNGMPWVKYYDTAGYDKDITLDKSPIEPYLDKCQPVIVRVFNPDTNDWHWVVITSKSGDTYNIIDPNYDAKTSLASYSNNIYAIVVYKKEGECK